MLKTELHTHINADPKDRRWIPYSARQLVDEAIKQNFDVLAITCHNLVYRDGELQKYAAEQGLLLIFGIERDIENKHVLMYNITSEEANNIYSFEDLATLREKRNIFTIAAHPPYFGRSCLRSVIYKQPNLFDAWEHSFLYTSLWNPNKKMLVQAQKYAKPVVGNSDVHLLKDLGRTYTLIDAEKNEAAVFVAIKAGKVQIITKPLPPLECLHIIGKALWSSLRHALNRKG